MRKVAFALVCLCACGDNIKPGTNSDATNGTHDAALPADGAPDAMPDGRPAQGNFFHYVADRVLLPTSTALATTYGLDLDGNGTIDNSLGKTIATFSMGAATQEASDTAVFEGAFSMLMDIQTTDFASAPAAGFALFSGTDPVPAACNSGEKVTCSGTGSAAVCTGCQHDLTGSGAFTIDSNAPTNPALLGSITAGTFTAGPGALSLSLSFEGQLIDLDLIGAKIKATGVTATEIGTQTGATTGIIIGGGIPQTEIDTKIDPAIATTLTAVLAGCTSNGTKCTCSNSTATEIASLFDTNGDCIIETSEVMSNGILQGFLKPDVTLDGMPCLSMGVKAYAVGATYTVTGE